MPKVSVIIPAYNHVRYIKQCVDSVLAQTYPHIEVIIDKCLLAILQNSMRLKRSLCVVVLMLDLVAFSPVLAGNPQARNKDAFVWSTPIALINIGMDGEVAVAVDPYDRVHVLWSSSESDDDSSPPVLFHTQWDGQTWTDPLDVIAQPEANEIRFPVLASAPDGELYVCWTGANALLYFSHAHAIEASVAWGWSEAVPISHAPILHSDIKTDRYGGIHVLYAVSGADVYYTRSENQGATWSQPVNVSGRPRDVATDYPRLAIDGRGRLHAVWTDAAMPQGVPILGTSYTQSLDGGRTWSSPLEVTTGEDYAHINVFTVGDNEIHLAWNGRVGFGGRYHQWSADGGHTWSRSEEIIPKNAIGGGKTGPPDMAVDSSGTLHLVSGMNPGGVMYLFWTGKQWSEPYLIRSEVAEKARIVVSEGNKLHVLWQQWYSTKCTEAPSTVATAREKAISPGMVHQQPSEPSGPTPLPDAEMPFLEPAAEMESTPLAMLFFSTAAVVLVIVLAIATRSVASRAIR